MNHVRHMQLFDCTGLRMTVVGAGGIGAMACLGLGKMGVSSITIYDDDVVSEENLATQLHKLADIDREKVFGLEETIQMFTDDPMIFPYDERVIPHTSLSGDIIVSAVDSINARKDIWAAVKNSGAHWYIDARMSAEEYQQYTVNMYDPEMVTKYDQKIMGEDDSRIEEIPCTAKATFFCSLISGGHIGATVRRLITGESTPWYLVHNILHNKLFALGEVTK